MNVEQPTPATALRLWPGVAAATLLWLGWLVIPALVPEWAALGFIAAAAFGLVTLVWWLFFSRAAWLERLGAIVLMIVAVAATSRVVHESIANGLMGYMLIVYSIPALSLALVVGAAAGRGRSSGRRRAAMVAAILLACGSLTLIRTNGVTGDADSDIQWRWTPTPEQRLLAQTADEPPALAPAPASAPATQPEKQPAQPSDEPAAAAPAAAAPAAPVATTSEKAVDEEPASSVADPAGAIADWTGFRGPARDGVVRDVRIQADWSRSAPVELWRRPIGPGWSSFAVHRNRVYTQEQRGEDEMVSAYDLGTGAPVWRHRDAARFWESNAGAGPRATPTFAHGRVYTLGGTGILNALDARDGSVVWSRNAASDTGRKIPDWGFASSPLAVRDLVVVATAGSLAAYDAATGNPRWFGPTGGWGYSSPHLSVIDGVEQIVLLNGPGAIGVDPSDGTVLWKHEWASDGILQPALVAGSDVLIASGSGIAANTGMQRVSVAHEGNAWMVNERWTSRGLKPYFSDFVVHEGHAYGFDGSILACISVEDGARKWKGGRYGHGQLVLLPDQDLLLVLSEEGELALVRAAPDQYTELARVPAIEGKTWNHPVLVGNVLLVRNGEEMAAFRLPVAGR